MSTYRNAASSSAAHAAADAPKPRPPLRAASLSSPSSHFSALTFGRRAPRGARATRRRAGADRPRGGLELQVLLEVGGVEAVRVVEAPHPAACVSRRASSCASSSWRGAAGGGYESSRASASRRRRRRRRGRATRCTGAGAAPVRDPPRAERRPATSSVDGSTGAELEPARLAVAVAVRLAQRPRPAVARIPERLPNGRACRRPSNWRYPAPACSAPRPFGRYWRYWSGRAVRGGVAVAVRCDATVAMRRQRATATVAVGCAPPKFVQKKKKKKKRELPLASSPVGSACTWQSARNGRTVP